MDFLDPNKKRSNKIKLFLGYALMAVAISIGTVILLFAASGYSVDRSGNVVQNGLVFMSSRPDGAQIYLEGVYNGFKQQAQTNNRMIVKEGRYKVTLQKDGYRSWQRFFSLEGGGIERMVYPLLFPEKLDTTELKQYASEASLVTSSPDRQWIVVQQPGSFTSFDVFNANDPEQAPTTLAVPANVLTAAKGSQDLEVLEWSTDNNNILCKHTYDGKVEFVVINRDKPAESFNVNTVTGQTPYNVVLKDKKVEQLYLHMGEGGLLQTVDVKTRRLTPLVGRAYAFKPHGNDMLVYVTAHATKANTMSVRILTNEKDYELRELPANTKYVVDVAKFDNSWYVVAGAASEDKVYVYEDPLTTLISVDSQRAVVARTLRIKDPQAVSFSANARFMAAQSGQEFAIYDAETDRQYRYDIETPLDSGRPAEWMDGHRMVTSTKEQTLVFEFDGINQQQLMPVTKSSDAMFDRDYENVYSFAPSTKTPGSFALTRTKLLVEN